MKGKWRHWSSRGWQWRARSCGNSGWRSCSSMPPSMRSLLHSMAATTSTSVVSAPLSLQWYSLNSMRICTRLRLNMGFWFGYDDFWYFCAELIVKISIFVEWGWCLVLENEEFRRCCYVFNVLGEVQKPCRRLILYMYVCLLI